MTKQQILDMIEEFIKANGLQEISGQVLNLILTAIAKIIPDDTMLTSSFGGSVTPASIIAVTPGHQKWVFANPGTYPNYGGFTFVENKINILSYDGAQWQKLEIAIPVDGKTDFLIETKKDLVADFSSCTWIDGSYYNSDGTIGSAVSTYSRISNDIPVVAGDDYSFICNAIAIIFYNDANEVVGYGGNANDVIFKERTFTASVGATKCHINVLTANKQSFVLYHKPQSSTDYVIKKGVIKFGDIAGVNILFTEIANYNSCTWVPGQYLDPNGTVQPFGAFNYCSNYIPVTGGVPYTFRSSGTSIIWYDANKIVIGSSGDVNDASAQRTFVAPATAKFSRINQHNDNIQIFSLRIALADGGTETVEIPNLRINASQIIGNVGNTSDQARLAKIGDVKMFNFNVNILPGNGIVSGDSTIDDHLGGIAIPNILKFSGTVTNISEPGENIAQQLGRWNALSPAVRSAANFVFVQIGLNDLGPSSPTTAVTIQALKDYFAKIRLDSPNAVIVAGEMLPCKQRFIDLWGIVNGEVAYNKWKAMNASLPTIAGVNKVATVHGWLLNDGSDNLKDEFNIGDNIHENTNGRKMIAYSWLIATL